MRSAHTKTCISIAILLAFCACAFALDPSLDVSQYAHTAWKISDGFPKGIVNKIAQTPDGYLWIGTEFGLFRFDGVRAVPWQPPSGEHLPGNNVRGLLAAHDGTLWIGTLEGLASWKDGKLKQYSELAGRGVTQIQEDRDGTVWVAGFLLPTARLCAIRSGGVQCYGDDGRFGISASPLYEDGRGNLWVGTTTGLWRWKPGPPKFYPIPGPTPNPRGLIEGDNGAILISTRQGVRQLIDGEVEPYPLPGATVPFNPGSILRDRNGGLWIGTYSGLLHVHQGRTDAFTEGDGLSGDAINTLFEDREGNIWVASLNGIDRFRDFAVPTISVKQGLSNAAVGSVLAVNDGSLWIGTLDGLDRWKNGEFTIYRKRSVRTAAPLGVGGAVRQIIGSGLPDDGVDSLYQDEAGRVWLSTVRGMAYFENGSFIPVQGLPGGYVHSIAGDRSGNLWIANQNEGLFHLLGAKVVEQIAWARLGGKDVPMSMLADPVKGGLWLGYFHGGLVYFKDGQVRARYAAGDGLGEGRVNQLRLGSRGSLWAATAGGLSRIKDGKVATLTSKNGLPCDAVHWSIEDDDQTVWLYTACGLVRIPRSELDSWVSDPMRMIQSTVLDSADGVRNAASPSVYSPPIAKSEDGRFRFATYNGVSVIDPRHLPVNKLPPPVHVEEIVADDKTYDAASPGTQGLRLPPRVHNLEIHYTALSLVAPEKVRFRIKLEGQDPDWREQADRHENYTNLGPGHYRFRVKACNNSGVWNEEGAALEFAIDPAYYQTNWFRGLCVVAFLALLYGLYRVRVAQLRAQEEKFREAIESIPAIAFVCRPDGYRSFVNKGWVEYTGLTTEQSSGSRWQAAIHAEDLDRVVARWRASLASGDPLEYETRLRRADGEYRWFMTRAVPLRDKHGKIVKWYGTATDIEDRKRAEQLQADFAHLNRVTTMGELTASLAHEIKQPITATVLSADACLQWLNHDQPDLDEVRDSAKMIVQEGKRAAEIIERLRGLYKKSPPQREQVDVNEIAQEMTVMLRGEANRFGVSMRMDLATGLPKITADRVQLQQVLMNLMLNAIEAMKETGGVVMVKSHLEERGTVMISVSDTGVGLPTENVDQIFSAFFTTKPEGSGMGLAISRSIIESHGGRLWATPNDGRGATFYFTLPADVEEVTESGAEDAIQEKN